jgi:hypothetical protein
VIHVRLGRRARLACLAVAAVCFAGALALSVLAPQRGIPDTVSFAVTSGYVVFMLVFILSAPPPDEGAN